MTGPAHVAHMAAMGLLVAVAAPGLLRVLVRLEPRVDRLAPPAVVSLPAFVVLHAAVTLGGTALGAFAPAVLLTGAVAFWTPVFGVHRRLSDGARTLYLYLAMPMLDLAGVWMVAAGDSAGGLAMIVGMLPMAATTVALTWRWITAEDRRVALDDGGIREAA
jgi:hypothetical protein